MHDAAKNDARLARLADVTPVPLTATPVPPLERRNLERRDRLQRRICNEFVEMPGTALTVEQGARLFGLTSVVCGRLFDELVRAGRLQEAAGRRYRLKGAA